MKLLAPKVARVLVMGIPRLSFGSPGTKCHLDVAPVNRHIKYFKGKVVASPQVQAVVSLVNSTLPLVRPNTKNAQTMH